MSYTTALLIVEILLIGILIGIIIITYSYNPYGIAEYYFRNNGAKEYHMNNNSTNIKIYYDTFKKKLYLQYAENASIQLEVDKRDKAGHSYKIIGNIKDLCHSNSPFGNLCKLRRDFDGEVIIRFNRDYSNIDLLANVENFFSK